MDMTASTAAKTDQINNVDLIKTGPITVTIKRVTEGPKEQPFNFHTEETPGRAYRPSLTMRRMMIAAWGPNPEAYIGHSLTLYRNPATKYGTEQTGGIEISHMSHIDKPVTRSLTATRGRNRNFTVKPLAAPVQDVVRDWPSEIDATTTTAALTALYQQIRQIPSAYTDELKAAFTDRGAALKVTAAPEQTEEASA